MPDPHPPLKRHPTLPGPGSLLEAYVKGDPEAFAQLVRQTTPLVMAVTLRRCGGLHALAEEAAQVVFVDLARRAPSLHADATLLGWLHQRATWAAADLMKQEHRRTRREQIVASLPNRYHLNEDPAAQRWEECRADVDQALARLRLDERTAILLRCAEGQDFSSVGAALSCSAEAARKKVSRALEKLRAALGRSSPGLTAALLLAGLTKDQVHAAAGSGFQKTAAQLAARAVSQAGPIPLFRRVLPWLKPLGMGLGASAALLLVWPYLRLPRPSNSSSLTPPVSTPAVVKTAEAKMIKPSPSGKPTLDEGLSLDEIVKRLAAMVEAPPLPDDFTRGNAYRAQLTAEETSLAIRKLKQIVSPAGWSQFMSRGFPVNFWIPWASREPAAALDFLLSTLEETPDASDATAAGNLLMTLFSTICQNQPVQSREEPILRRTRDLVAWASAKLSSKGPHGWSPGQQVLIYRGQDLAQSVIKTGDRESIRILLDLINTHDFPWLDSALLYVTTKDILITMSELMPQLHSPARRNNLLYAILAKLATFDAPEAMRQVESIPDPELRWGFAKAIARPTGRFAANGDLIIDEAAKSRTDWWLQQAVPGKELECAGVIFNEWSSVAPEWIVDWMTGHFSRETAQDAFRKKLSQEIHNYAIRGQKEFAPGLKRKADLLRKLDPRGAEAFISNALMESAGESQIHAAREVLKP